MGGFGGSESTAGADALRRGSEGGAASTARKSERSNDPSAKGFSEGLRGQGSEGRAGRTEQGRREERC